MKINVPEQNLEKDAVGILKDIWLEEENIIKKAKRAMLSINLLFVLSIIFFAAACYLGYLWTALPAFGLVGIATFIMNAMILALIKISKKQRDSTYEFYMNYEHKRLQKK